MNSNQVCARERGGPTTFAARYRYGGVRLVCEGVLGALSLSACSTRVAAWLAPSLTIGGNLVAVSVVASKRRGALPGFSQPPETAKREGSSTGKRVGWRSETRRTPSRQERRMRSTTTTAEGGSKTPIAGELEGRGQQGRSNLLRGRKDQERLKLVRR